MTLYKWKPVRAWAGALIYWLFTMSAASAVYKSDLQSLSPDPIITLCMIIMISICTFRFHHPWKLYVRILFLISAWIGQAVLVSLIVYAIVTLQDRFLMDIQDILLLEFISTLPFVFIAMKSSPTFTLKPADDAAEQ